MSWVDLMEEGLLFRDQVGTLEAHVPFLVGQHSLPSEFTFSSSCTEIPLAVERKIPDFPDVGKDSAYLHQVAPNSSSPTIWF